MVQRIEEYFARNQENVCVNLKICFDMCAFCRHLNVEAVLYDVNSHHKPFDIGDSMAYGGTRVEFIAN